MATRPELHPLKIPGPRNVPACVLFRTDRVIAPESAMPGVKKVLVNDSPLTDEELENMRRMYGDYF